MHSESADWPAGVILRGGRLIHEGLICVPETLTEFVMRECHKAMGHTGIQKLTVEAKRRYRFPDQTHVENLAQHVRSSCAVCQACDHPNFAMAAPLRPTHVPPFPMTSVAMDVFFIAVGRVGGAAIRHHSFVCRQADRLDGGVPLPK